MVKEYAFALTFFKRWKAHSVASPREMTAALAKLDSTQHKLDYLRGEIEMRVRGLGFVEYNTSTRRRGHRARTRRLAPSSR